MHNCDKIEFKIVSSILDTMCFQGDVFQAKTYKANHLRWDFWAHGNQGALRPVPQRQGNVKPD